MDGIGRLEHADAIARLWARDASLFSDDLAVQAEVSPWLGWLGLGEGAGPLLERVTALAAVAAEGISDVVLLGMGGSSLAPLVISHILPEREGAPTLTALDTSSPATVLETMDRLEPRSTLFVLASKSGGTIEPNSLYAVFRGWMDTALGREAAGRHFVAMTDPGTSLESLAASDGFLDVLHGPPDVGGRYSALTGFGLLPTALISRNAGLLCERAASMERECRAPATANPGAALAAWMADGHASDRDKLTLVTSPGLESFGLWVEQLVAESTGKHGTGILPVIERHATMPPGFGNDRIVCVVRWAEDAALADWASALTPDTPVFEAVLSDPYDLGAEFVRWEVATSLVGYLLGINPFDQPSVTEAKEATSGLLAGRIAPPQWDATVDRVKVAFGNLPAPSSPSTLAELLAPPLSSLAPADYLAILSYVPDGPGMAPLAAAAQAIARRTGNACVVQLGPRYLHSTGQLHKGGPNTGVYLVVTTADQPEVAVPGHDFSLGELYVAQALGDVVTLVAHGRRVVAVELPDSGPASVMALARALETSI